jgi:hypothetical protein
VVVPERLQARLADPGTDDDQLFQGGQSGQVRQPAIPDRRMAQVDYLGIREIAKKRQVCICDPGVGQRDDNRVPLPDAVTTEGLDALPGGLRRAIRR